MGASTNPADTATDNLQDKSLLWLSAQRWHHEAAMTLRFTFLQTVKSDSFEYGSVNIKYRI